MTHSAPVGWLGLVFVAPAARGRGLGARLTRASLELLASLGCRSVLLAATDLGQLPDRTGTIVIPTANAAAAEHLRTRGFVLQRELPRMRLGDPVSWRPTGIWAISTSPWASRSSRAQLWSVGRILAP